MFIDEPQETDQPVIESEEPEIVEEAEEQEETTTDWEAEAKKWKAIAKRHSKPKVEEAPSQTNGLSPRDFLALKDSNITADDFDEVQDFAKYKGIPIAEALSHPTLKNILNDRAEERRTARATETKSPRGLAKNSSEDILRKAEQSGEVPESMEGMRALAEARLARRRK